MGEDGWGGFELGGVLLHGAHDAEEIAAVDFFDVGEGVAFFEQGEIEDESLESDLRRLLQLAGRLSWCFD